MNANDNARKMCRSSRYYCSQLRSDRRLNFLHRHGSTKATWMHPPKRSSNHRCSHCRWQCRFPRPRRMWLRSPSRYWRYSTRLPTGPWHCRRRTPGTTLGKETRTALRLSLTDPSKQSGVAPLSSALKRRTTYVIKKSYNFTKAPASWNSAFANFFASTGTEHPSQHAAAVFVS